MLNLLHAHPAGLRMDYLAEQVGVPEALLRREILDFTPRTPWECARTRSSSCPPKAGGRPGIRGDGAGRDRQAGRRIGVELQTPQKWLEVYQTAARMSEMRPDDTDLAEAVQVIAQRIPTGVPQRPDSEIGRVLSEAISKRIAVEIEYSRTWKPGLVDRKVHPLRLVETARGWELDALLPDDEVRTFIIDRIRDGADPGLVRGAPRNHRSAGRTPQTHDGRPGGPARVPMGGGPLRREQHSRGAGRRRREYQRAVPAAGGRTCRTGADHSTQRLRDPSR